MIVKISSQHVQQIVDQAREEFPLECCGLLAGIRTPNEILIKKVVPLYNTDQSSELFSMDPKEQFAAIKQMRSEGYTIVGNYHSHPNTPSRPSLEDIRLAYDSEMLYGIVSLKDEVPDLNFFRIRSEELVEKVECILT